MKIFGDIIDGTRAWDMEKVEIGTGALGKY